MRFLVNNRANIDLQNSKGLTALHISAHKGDSEIVHFLAVKNADVNLQVGAKTLPMLDLDFNTHIFIYKTFRL